MTTIVSKVVSEAAWPARQRWPARLIRLGTAFALCGLGIAVWQAATNTRWGGTDWARVWITIGLIEIVIGVVWLGMVEWRYRRR